MQGRYGEHCHLNKRQETVLGAHLPALLEALILLFTCHLQGSLCYQTENRMI